MRSRLFFWMLLTAAVAPLSAAPLSLAPAAQFGSSVGTVSALMGSEPLASGQLLAAKGGVSQGEAVRIAQRRYGGKAIKVERGGGVFYVRLLLPNGRVKQVVVDASSGEISD